MSGAEQKEARRIGRKMLEHYQRLDRVFEKASSEHKVSCKAGCASCCYQLAASTLPEGLAIAEHLIDTRPRELPQLVRALFEQQSRVPEGRPEDTRAAYFRAKVPCAFLDRQTNLCTIYAVRPGACRYYAVVSDPALCAPELEGGVVQQIDARELQLSLVNKTAQLLKRAHYDFVIGPLPYVVLLALSLLTKGRAGYEAMLAEGGFEDRT